MRGVPMDRDARTADHVLVATNASCSQNGQSVTIGQVARSDAVKCLARTDSIEFAQRKKPQARQGDLGLFRRALSGTI